MNADLSLAFKVIDMEKVAGIRTAQDLKDIYSFLIIEIQNMAYERILVSPYGHHVAGICCEFNEREERVRVNNVIE